MARKRKTLEKWDYASKEYWNRLLVEEGLSMSRGLNADKMVYVGDSQQLDKIQESLSQNETGRTAPKERCD